MAGRVALGAGGRGRAVAARPARGALLLLFAATLACRPGEAGAGRDAATADRAVSANRLLITLCGARVDLLDAALAAGDLPTLAALRARAGASPRVFTSAHVDCVAAHRERLAMAMPGPLPAHGAAVLSRAELIGLGAAELGCTREDAPQLERFTLEIDGPDAAPTRLRREPAATAAAAIAWLARATTPFLLWVQFEALASEECAPDAPREELAAIAHRRLVAVDAALAPLLAELARAGRDRRTRIVVATDHGEAHGEEGRIGPRSRAPAATRATLWIIDPADPQAGLLRDPAAAVAAAPIPLDEVEPPQLPDVRALTRAARGESEPGLTPAERLERAREACRRAPWYFPAFRAAATLQQQQGDPHGTLDVLAEYARVAPLAPAARAAFEQLHAATRARIERTLPGASHR